MSEAPDDIRATAAKISKWHDTPFLDGLIVTALWAERERCAAVCDKEVAAMQRVADFHRPPRVDYDPDLADLHDQGAAVAFKLAAAIRAKPSE